jgi:hypothetical protein
MAYPILGSPKPAFFDSSGDPLASGTITTLNPSNDAVKASYPTADDANASTNGTSGDITLDSRGEPTSTQYWGKDNEDYKVVIKDSAGTTIYTMDDIRMPAHSRRARVAFTGADPTPSVAEGNEFYTVGTTAITFFDDGEVGDTIFVYANSNITITHNTTIRLAGSVNFDMVTGDLLTLTMNSDGIWREVSRATVTAEYEVVAATNVITAAESGKVFFLNSATEFASTLPAPALGLNYTFICSGAASGANYTVGSNGGDNIMDVYILDVVGELTYAASQDVVTFVDGNATGDKLEVVSDGTNWFCYGLCGVDSKMTSGAT